MQIKQTRHLDGVLDHRAQSQLEDLSGPGKFLSEPHWAQVDFA
jgi:hypothetical protein